MSTANGTVLALLGRTELLVAVGGRDRLVATTLEPRPRVGERVVVCDGVAVARVTAEEAAVAYAVRPGATGRRCDRGTPDP